MKKEVGKWPNYLHGDLLFLLIYKKLTIPTKISNERHCRSQLRITVFVAQNRHFQ
jgi:hypothetical protein